MRHLGCDATQHCANYPDDDQGTFASPACVCGPYTPLAMPSATKDAKDPIQSCANSLGKMVPTLRIELRTY